MISKRNLIKRSRRKSDEYIVETILAAKKNESWNKIAQKISGPRRRYNRVNLKFIEKETKAGDTIVVAGKVLGSGEISKKIRICALHFSESARGKLEKSKSEIVTILEEIKKNPKAEGVRVLG